MVRLNALYLDLIFILIFILIENENSCVLPKDEGYTCDKTNTSEKWYFDPTISACQKLIYQGCGGNLNRFDTRNQCENKCNANSAFLLDTSSFLSNLINFFIRIYTSIENKFI